MIETAASLISNLTFKNENAKQAISKSIIISSLVKTLAKQSNPKTEKHLLRCIGNCALLQANTDKLVQDHYHQLLISKIGNYQYREKNEII